MNTKNNPQVYVGTYAKYNSSNLDGAWIDLTQFNSYEEFIAKCNEVHKDEREPELMIQDSMYMPDGLDVMESISKQEFNDIIIAWKEQQPKCEVVDYSEKAFAVIGDTKAIKDQLKKIGGRFNPRLSCGAGWIFSKTKLAEVQRLIDTSEVKENATDKEFEIIKNTFAEYLAQSNDAKYCKQYYIGAVKLNEGYYLIEKDSIETRFCWADEGEDYERYKRVTSNEDNLKEYFLWHNLKRANKLLKELRSDSKFYIGDENYRKKVYIYTPYYSWEDKRNPNDVEVSAEQRAMLIKAVEYRLQQFEKRLYTYLKRYGVSKIHTWTYWKDA